MGKGGRPKSDKKRYRLKPTITLVEGRDDDLIKVLLKARADGRMSQEMIRLMRSSGAIEIDEGEVETAVDDISDMIDDFFM